jgi:hypothetical protein
VLCITTKDLVVMLKSGWSVYAKLFDACDQRKEAGNAAETARMVVIMA